MHSTPTAGLNQGLPVNHREMWQTCDFMAKVTKFTVWENHINGKIICVVKMYRDAPNCFLTSLKWMYIFIFNIRKTEKVGKYSSNHFHVNH